MSEVFIAHDRGDRDRAVQLVAALQSRSYRAWWDFDFLPHRIEGQALRSVVDRTGVTLLIWSPRGAVSDVVVDVASHAAAQAKLVAVRFEDVRVPPAFAAWPAIDLSYWDGAPDSAELDALIAQIEARSLSFLPEEEGLRRARDKRLTQDVSAFAGALQKKKGDAIWKSYLDRWPDGMFSAIAAGEMRSSVGEYTSPVELADEPGAGEQWRTQASSPFAGVDASRFARPALVSVGVLALVCGIGFGSQFLDLTPRSAPADAAIVEVAQATPAAGDEAVGAEPLAGAVLWGPTSDAAADGQAPLSQPEVQQRPPERSSSTLLTDVPAIVARREPPTQDGRARGPAPERASVEAALAPPAPTPARRESEPPQQMAQAISPTPTPDPAPAQRSAQSLAPADGAPFDVDALDRSTRDAVESARRAERRARAAADAHRSGAQTASVRATNYHYAGDTSRGAPQGLGEALWQSGARYRGAWRAGHQHGWGVLTYANGERYEGEFAGGRPTGNGVLWASNGQRVIGAELYATLLRRPG